MNWWSPRNAKVAKCIDFLSGRQWDDAELEAFKKKNKTPVVYNFLKPAERTIIGNFLNSQWDLKWIPTGGKGDDKLVAGLEALRIREAQQQKDAFLDSETYSMGWATGLSYQQLAMDYSPGMLPRPRTENLSRFSVYPEATSRDTITRDDAMFIDLVNWYTAEDMISVFPERADYIREMSAGHAESSYAKNAYTQYNVSTDRGHETSMYRDGMYKVIERYYRVRRDQMDPEQRGPSISPITGRPYCPPGIPHMEELWYAVVVEQFGSNQYLFNGRYHCQTINPMTGKILWPILEYCFESVNGEPHSGIEFDLDPSRAFNALMSNLLHSAKHASSQSIFLDRAAFATEKDFQDAAKYHADADRAFAVKEGRAMNAAAPVPHAQSSQDLYSALEYAKNALDELSAAPPALQGMREGNQSGILHSQLVTQSETQLAHSKSNYEKFLERKYLVRYILWRQYYSEEMVVQIIDPTPEQRQAGEQQIVMNQMVPKVDQYGFEIPGEVDVLNDIDAILYDVSVVASSRSYSQRMKTQSQLAEVAQSPALANDPGLAAIVLEAQIDLSDIDPKYKDMISQRREQMSQNEQAQNQAAQAEAQAIQGKAQSAQQSAQAQVTVANATAQSMQGQLALKQQELQMKVGESAGKNQMEQAKMGMDMQTAQQNASTQAQQNAFDIQIKQLELQAQQRQQASDAQMAQMDMALKQMDLKMKEIEVQSRHRESLNEAFAPVGRD